jgi:YegS/Rv2252/BmrU family lipid kinase
VFGPVRTAFVVNPTAGGGRARRVWERVRPHLDGLGPWTVAFTRRPGHATSLARAAAEAGDGRVVVVGGDGTVSEAVNGLVGTRVPLGVVPAGGGNDFARSLALPADPVRAARLAVRGTARAVDLGDVRLGARRRCFANVSGVGFDAEVAAAIARAGATRFGGRLAHVLGVLSAVRRFRPVPVRLTLDGRAFERTVLLAVVANGRSFAGGMLVAPDARLDDGLLDVWLGGELTPLETLALLPRLYAGTHSGHPKVESYRCREVEVRSDERLLCHADGEVIGETPARFTVHPGGLLCVTGEAGGGCSGLPRGVQTGG